MKNFKITTIAFAGMVMFGACQKEPVAITDSFSGDPAVVTYRSDCAQGTLLDPATYTEEGGGNVDILQFGYETNSARISQGQCSGTFGAISWTSELNGEGECTNISWTWNGPGSPCGVIFILKGGSSGANVYTYEEGCTSGWGLNAADNASGGPAGLSNITIGYNTCYEVVCQYETAWGGSSAGAGSAWWYYFNTQGNWTQPIYAGQNMLAGYVEYDGANFNIVLENGWELDASKTDPVKAQGYNTLPNKRPAAGLFTLYKGGDLTFAGNGSLYYAIHLDLQQCE